MKTLKTKFAATILAVGLICLLCSGCGGNYKPIKCNYCGGDINYQIVDKTFWNEQSSQRYVAVGDKKYHEWCVKISRLQT